MRSGPQKWNCKSCGCPNVSANALGEAPKCAYCADAAAPPTLSVLNTSDFRRREVVARLRGWYGEARELVSRQQPHAESYGHLEWILGTRRNRDQDEAAFDIGVSELVVLWLQDLALELDGPDLSPDQDAGPGATSAAGPRRAAAQGLRAATLDFAELFLSPRLVPVGQP